MTSAKPKRPPSGAPSEPAEPEKDEKQEDQEVSKDDVERTEIGDGDQGDDPDKKQIPLELDLTPTPLILAVKSGNTSTVKKFIQEIPIEDRVEVINYIPGDGQAAIFHALDGGQVDILQLILEYGANPNTRDLKLNSPLHIACVNQNKIAMQKLIYFGASLLGENLDHQQPHQTVKNGDQQLIASTQAYLAQMQEQLKEEVKAKDFYVMPLEQRSYFRSMFDIIDSRDTGVITLSDILPLLESFPKDEEGKGPELEAIMEWYKEIDQDHNGSISFKEFLRANVLYLAEVEKAKKKNKTKKGGKKKG